MKTAVITGSVKGIGKSIGLKLLEEGCFVIFNYTSDDTAAKQLDEELSIENKKNYSIIKCDLSSMANAEIFTKKCIEMRENIDYLILNAGCTDRTAFENVTEESWYKVMDVNLNVPFFLVQKFSPYINDNDGRILFIGSKMGIMPHASSVAYGVSKAGIHFLAKCLVKEFADRKITVNAIAPGFVDTPWQKAKPVDQRARIEAKTALERFALPEEVADFAYSVLNNPYINGAVLEIDGGYVYK